jgi:integrase
MMSVRKRKWTTKMGLEKEAWVVDYADQQGVRRQKTFARKKDADAWGSQTLVDVRKGEHVADSASVTVKQAGEAWIESCNADGLERTTIVQYRQHLDLHIVPFLGRTKLSQLSVPAVREFMDKLREEGRSAEMVKRVTVSLGSLIADAYDRGLVSRNVIREMTRRKKRGKKRQGERRQKARIQVGVDIPSPAEIAAIIQSAKGRWRPLLIAAAFSGLRGSELRGLRWSDVDLEGRLIHVRQRADRYHKIGMPKSDAGHRRVPIGPFVVTTLREWKLSCPKGDLDLVFPNTKGNVESHSTILKRALPPPQIVAGVVNKEGQAKYTGMHALRHFFASWCINREQDGGLGLPPKAVQDRLGHSTIAMTMDTYGHIFPSNDDTKALAAAEKRLLSAVNAT